MTTTPGPDRPTAPPWGGASLKVGAVRFRAQRRAGYHTPAPGFPLGFFDGASATDPRFASAEASPLTRQ